MISRFMLQIVIFKNISICKVFSYQKFFLIFFLLLFKDYRSLISYMLIYIDLIRHKVSCINESLPKVCLSKFKASHMKWKNISRDSKTFKNPPPLFFPGLLQNLWVLWYTLYILFIWPIYLLFIEKNRTQRITSRSDNKSGPSQTGGWGGLYPPQFLAKQLTLSQPGGQIIPTSVLRAPPLPPAWIHTWFHAQLDKKVCDGI